MPHGNRLGPIVVLCVAAAAFLCLSAFLFPTARLEDGALASPASGIAPVKVLPEGVRITSGAGDLRIDIVRKNVDDASDVRFHLLLPPGASTEPEVLDYRLVACAASPHGPAAKSTSPRASPLGSDRPTSSSPTAILRSDEKRLAFNGSEEIRGMIRVEDKGILRFYRMAEVVFQPRRLQAGSRGSYAAERLSFRLRFSKPVARPSALAETKQDRGFARILRRLVANPEAAPLYADRSQGQASTPSPQPRARWTPPRNAGNPCFKVAIVKDGLYRITADHLTSAGLDPATISPRSVRVYSRGKEVPSALAGTKGSRFTENDAVVFYGLESTSPYSRERAYWVCASPLAQPPPLRMPMRRKPGAYDSRTTPTITTRQERVFEEDNVLTIQHGNFLSIKGKETVWKEIDPRDPTKFPFDLPDADPRSTEPIPLEVRLHFAPPESEGVASMREIPPLILRVNDGFTTTLPPFTDPTSDTRRFEIPVGVLRETGDVLSLQFQTPYEPEENRYQVYLDSFRLSYWRGLIARGNRLQIRTRPSPPWHKITNFAGESPLLFDLTDLEKPEVIETEMLTNQMYAFHEARPNRRLLAATPSAIDVATSLSRAVESSIASPENEADYLIIYHPRFADEIKPLIALHESQGMKVRSASVEEIYQEYSFGELTPQAIKDFLYDALRRWKTPPTYVCLFGDATSDYRNELQSGVPNLVPAYSYKGSEDDTWASENWYASLIGPDLMPDVLLGRLSVQHVEDAREVVRKVVEYAKNPPMGPWRSRVAFCADDSGFRETAETLCGQYLPRSVGNKRIYLEEFPYEDNFYLPRDTVAAKDLKVSSAATVELLRTYNAGVAMMTYFGHGSPNIWTDERIWFGGDSPNSDNQNLRNGSRLPFVTTYTCNHGAFDYPMPKWDICISEDMMRVREGGAIALFVPSGPGVTTTHERIAQALYEALFREDLRSLGETTALADVYCLLDGGADDMVRMFVLLGDPALDLAIPTRQIKGTVTPKTVDVLDALREREILFEGSTGEMARGRFVATLYDAEGQEVSHTKPMPFHGGKIRWSFRLPPNPQPGEWAVRVYCGNDRKKQDAALYGVLHVSRPVLRIASFDFETAPSKAGDKVALLLRIENPCDLPAQGVPVRVTREDDAGRREFLAAQTVRVDARSTCTLRGLWTASPGLHHFAAAIDRFTLPISDEKTPEAAKDFAVQIPDPKTSAVRTLASLARVHWRAGNPVADLSIATPVYYNNLRAPLPCEARLEDDRGKLVATRQLTLDTSRTAMVEPAFDLKTPPRDLRKSYLLVISGSFGGIKKTLTRVSIPLGPPDLPDLRARPGSAQFTPRRPSEGDTVFMRVLVENRGRALSGPFALRASSLDAGQREAEATLLYSRPDLSVFSQPPLAPGRSRWVNLRWDYSAYKECAGQKIIRLRIDASDQMPATGPGADVMDTPLRIVRRAHVKVVDLKDDSYRVTPTVKQVNLTATVQNVGDATAWNRNLGFFTRKPDPSENARDPRILVKEIPLAPLAGNRKVVYSHKWRVDLTDPRTSPTAQVYQSTRAIRTGTVETTPEPDW